MLIFIISCLDSEAKCANIVDVFRSSLNVKKLRSVLLIVDDPPHIISCRVIA